MFVVHIWGPNDVFGSVTTRKNISDSQFIGLVEETFYKFRENSEDFEEETIESYVDFHNGIEAIKIEVVNSDNFNYET